MSAKIKLKRKRNQNEKIDRKCKKRKVVLVNHQSDVPRSKLLSSSSLSKKRQFKSRRPVKKRKKVINRGKVVEDTEIPNFNFMSKKLESKKPNSSYIDIYKTKETFDLILADPPWKYSGGLSLSKKYAGQCIWHYDTMSLEELKKVPVPKISSDNSILLLWTTGPKLNIGVKLMEAWGFEYMNSWIDWHKMNARGELSKGGLGTYNTIISEYVLIGSKGSGIRKAIYVPPMLIYNDHVKLDDTYYLLLGKKGRIYPYREQTRSVRFLNVMEERLPLTIEPSSFRDVRRRHSEKPKSVYNRIERIFPHVKNKVELFARNNRTGWNCWGLECKYEQSQDEIVENKRLEDQRQKRINRFKKKQKKQFRRGKKRKGVVFPLSKE